MSIKKVAIIGAGPTGLCCAKSALENNLYPVIFDKASQPGGLWIPKRTVWDSLRINSSKFFTSFIDFPWPDNQCMFPSGNQVYDYLMNYIKAHSLEKYFRLNTLVEKITQPTGSDKWEITTLNLTNDSRTVEVYDCLLIACGLNRNSNIPKFNGIDKFKGKIIHSSNYRSAYDDLFKSKNVTVIGCSCSAVEIASDLVGKADKITNIFSRPYLVLKRLIKIKCDNEIDSEDNYNLIPADFFLFNREFNQQLKKDSKKEYIKFLYDKFSLLCPDQLNDTTDKNFKDLKVNLNEQELVFAVSENYIENVRNGKILAKKSQIKQVTESGLILDDESFIKTDVIIYATSYCIDLDFFDEKILKSLKFDISNYQNPLILYENTWHPEFKNLAFIGLARGYFFSGAELQAICACKVFNKDIQLPNEEVMYEQMRLSEEKRINNDYITNQFPYGNHIDLIDNLASKLNLLPDFESLKESNNKIYKMLWFNGWMPFIFMFKKNFKQTLELLDKVDFITNRKYTSEEIKRINIFNFE